MSTKQQDSTYGGCEDNKTGDKNINEGQATKDMQVMNTVTNAGTGVAAEKPCNRINVKDFIAECSDITQSMHEACQPFLGFISKGVREKYITPLIKRNEMGTINGRLHDISFMSTGGPIFASSPAEVRQRIQTNKILKFPLGVIIGGKIVQLCKLYNDRDFVGGWIACLIMLPEEAEHYDPTWHFPEELGKDEIINDRNDGDQK